MILYKTFCKNVSEKKFLSFDNQIISFKDFKFKADLIAKRLEKQIKNKKILVQSKDQKLIALLFVASSKINANITVINDGVKINQIKKFIKIVKPGVFIYENDKIYKMFKSLIFLIKDIEIYKTTNEKLSITKKITKKKNENKPYIITFSSGTTSVPKPIVFSEKIKLQRFEQMRKIYSVKSKDTILSLSSLDHSMGQRMFFLSILNGSNFIYCSKYNYKVLHELIIKYNISFAVLPPNYLNLLKEKFIKKKIFIKKIVSATSALSNKDKKEFLKTKIQIFEMYGASEIGTVTSMKVDKKSGKLDTVGKILPGIDIKILGDNFKFKKKNQLGEIVCKTPLRFLGYLKNPRLTKKSFYNNYFKTGDIGMIDNDNYLKFVSRKQDVIISSGKNIYPIDIEKELQKIKNIKECAIIGISDKYFGEVAIAICVLNRNQKNIKSKILDHLSTKVADYQLPKEIYFEKKLPKNRLGKLMKSELRKKYNQKKIDLTKTLRLVLN